MYWILFVMGTLAAIAIAVLVGGLSTPRAHVVARTVTVPAPPETVWALLRDIERYPEWRSELRGVEIERDAAGVEWTESTGGRTLRFGLTREEPFRRLHTRLLDDDLGFSGEWHWELRPSGSGTRVLLTERGSVGNPIARFVAAHFVGHTRVVDAMLRALSSRTGDAAARIDAAAPEHPAT